MAFEFHGDGFKQFHRSTYAEKYVCSCYLKKEVSRLFSRSNGSRKHCTISLSHFWAPTTCRILRNIKIYNTASAKISEWSPGTEKSW